MAATAIVMATAGTMVGLMAIIVIAMETAGLTATAAVTTVTVVAMHLHPIYHQR